MGNNIRKRVLQHYVPPEVVQAVNVRLERNLLNSVIENVEKVETAGQEIKDFYDASATSSFNYDWSETPLE